MPCITFSAASMLEKSVIEHVDGSHLVRGGQASLVVDPGNQVLHLESSPVVSRQLGRPVGDFKPLLTAGARPARKT